MYGYPGMQLLGTGGGAVATVVLRRRAGLRERRRHRRVAGPRDTAYFNLGYNDVITDSTGCSMASQVEITPPNDTPYVVVPVFPGVIDVCGGGTLHVSPVFSSTDSAATVTTAPPAQGG